MWHPVILVQLQPKRAGWFQLAACTHWFLHLAATVEALCATAHFLRVFSGSLMNPPNRQKLWDVFNRSCILLPRLLPKSCRHNERFLSAQVRLLFQAYLVVLYRPKQGGRQGTAWRSSTLQDVRQNPSPALKESPRMCTEFGCKICMLCADCLQISVSKFSHCVHMCVCILRFQSVLASVCVDSNSMFYERKLNSVFYVHLLTFWTNGWKFRNSLPISKSLRCGSA